MNGVKRAYVEDIFQLISSICLVRERCSSIAKPRDLASLTFSIDLPFIFQLFERGCIQGHPLNESFQIRQKCLKWLPLCSRRGPVFGYLRGTLVVLKVLGSLWSHPNVIVILIYSKANIRGPVFSLYVCLPWKQSLFCLLFGRIGHGKGGSEQICKNTSQYSQVIRILQTCNPLI